VRPTAQRVREALFSSLGERVREAAVLDLYAGTGALGLEALARGARRVVFVERDPRLAARIRERLRRQGWVGRSRVWRAAVRTALRALEAAGERFDLILMDPPYGRGLLQETLDALAGGALLSPGARIVAEGHWRDEPHPPPGLTCVRTGRYGETRVWEYAARDLRGGDGRPSGDDGALSGEL